jgi:hypothetical protein
MDVGFDPVTACWVIPDPVVSNHRIPYPHLTRDDVNHGFIPPER